MKNRRISLICIASLIPSCSAFSSFSQRKRISSLHMVNTAIEDTTYLKKDTSTSFLPTNPSETILLDTINDDIQNKSDEMKSNNFIDSILESYLGPRITLALVAILYGTNFPLGALMDENLPASAATSSRMVLASLTLLPFLTQLKPTLSKQVFIGGAFVSMGYISQSIALIDTSPALVSFLGSVTVLVCPFLQWVLDKKPMGIRDAPQTWAAAFLCLSGVAALELFNPSSAAVETSRLGVGDALSLIQAIGFGTGMYFSEKMMKQEPDQALPITAGLVSTTAFFAMIWCFFDGWLFNNPQFGLPGLFLDPSLRQVALAVAWTGIISTSTNFFIEISALGRVPSAEASVILATEPLWSALFASVWLGTALGVNDYVGGGLMVLACLVSTLDPSVFGMGKER